MEDELLLALLWPQIVRVEHGRFVIQLQERGEFTCVPVAEPNITGGRI
jgi:hypothetical protein